MHNVTYFSSFQRIKHAQCCVYVFLVLFCHVWFPLPGHAGLLPDVKSGWHTSVCGGGLFCVSQLCSKAEGRVCDLVCCRRCARVNIMHSILYVHQQALGTSCGLKTTGQRYGGRVLLKLTCNHPVSSIMMVTFLPLLDLGAPSTLHTTVASHIPNHRL